MHIYAQHGFQTFNARMVKCVKKINVIFMFLRLSLQLLFHVLVQIVFLSFSAYFILWLCSSTMDQKVSLKG